MGRELNSAGAFSGRPDGGRVARLCAVPRFARSRVPLFVALAAALWGTSGTGQAFAPEAADPLSVGVAAMLLFATF